MADAAAAAKEQVKKGAEAKAKAVAEAEKLSTSTPTPTQEENDIAQLLGAQDEKKDDGSGPSPVYVLTKQVEADKAKPGYQTRAATPQPPKTS